MALANSFSFHFSEPEAGQHVDTFPNQKTTSIAIAAHMFTLEVASEAGSLRLHTGSNLSLSFWLCSREPKGKPK